MKIFSIFSLTVLLVLSGTATIYSQPDVERGQEIWSGECQACHTLGGGTRVGPDLEDINDKREEDWLVSFIRNAPAMIRDGDEQAVQVSNEYPGVMPAMEHLSEDDVRGVLAYIDEDREARATASPDDEPESEFGAVGERRSMENTSAHQNWEMLNWIFAGFSLITIMIALLFGYYIVIISRK